MKGTLVAASLLLATGVCQSAIIDSSDHSYLTDTVTGLDWLDVTASANLSYSYVRGQLGTSGAFSGWHFATGADFNSLVSNYTGIHIAPGNYSMVNQESNLIDGLISLLGSTYVGALNPDLYYTRGFIADNNNDKQYTAWLYSYDGIIPSVPDFSQARRDLLDPGVASSFGGSFLVRNTQYVEPHVSPSPVPAPPAFVLMLTGLGMFGLTKKFRKSA